MRNITPAAFACHTNSCCPSVHQLEDGRLAIVGKVDPAVQAQLQGKIGPNEALVIVDPGMVTGLKLA
jgi:hypothetical protein